MSNISYGEMKKSKSLDSFFLLETDSDEHGEKNARSN